MVCNLEPKLEPDCWEIEENMEEFYDSSSKDELEAYFDWLEMLDKQRN